MSGGLFDQVPAAFKIVWAVAALASLSMTVAIIWAIVKVVSKVTQ